ncbi:hypothetical protein [Herpetosiphon sp.]|uniref:Uncharacterized protein n=1 Tax=Herpetosiphon aurantiacus (strain ATCC 23779 / DSM 785 / 114-95) TaxID=316274 RepID=A9AVZ3_HERA2|nr:hypothetical protein [Herpetosiphon sp.]ABX03231.1 hypothetical protein Haur_0583 [Herpetosiphon aurantiacus DSM 785]
MKDISDKYIRKRIDDYSINNSYSIVSRIVMRQYLQKNFLIGIVLFLFILIVSISMNGLFLVKMIAASIISIGLLSFFTFFETILYTDKKAYILFLIIKHFQQTNIQPYQLTTLKDITALEASIVGTKTASTLIIITILITLGPVIVQKVHPLATAIATIVLLLILFTQILQGYADALIRQAIAMYEEQQALLKKLLE